MNKTKLIIISSLSFALMGMVSCQVERKWTEKRVDNFMAVSQEDGPTLAMFLSQASDWRLPAQERATDLASKLSVEEIAGLRNGIINDERVRKYKH